MSIPTIIIGIILLLFILFILIGIFIPEVKFSSKVEVNKPVSLAWKIFTDDSKMADWLPGFKSAEHISGEDNVPGSVYKMVFEEKGRVFEMMETIMAVEENKEFSFDLDHKLMSSKNSVLFESQGDKTIIQGLTNTKGKGIIMRGLFPFMLGSMKKSNQKTYDNLKKLIEEY